MNFFFRFKFSACFSELFTNLPFIKWTGSQENRCSGGGGEHFPLELITTSEELKMEK